VDQFRADGSWKETRRAHLGSGRGKGGSGGQVEGEEVQPRKLLYGLSQIGGDISSRISQIKFLTSWDDLPEGFTRTELAIGLKKKDEGGSQTNESEEDASR